jgi:hypothetical protein
LQSKHSEIEFDQTYGTNTNPTINIDAKDDDHEHEGDDCEAKDEQEALLAYEKKIEANEALWYKDKEIDSNLIMNEIQGYNALADTLTSFRDFREFDQFTIFQILNTIAIISFGVGGSFEQNLLKDVNKHSDKAD